VPFLQFILGSAEPAAADSQSLSNLRVLLWIGAAILIFAFGLLVILTLLRMVRRHYFRERGGARQAHSSPWEAAGQRAAPVEGGQLIDEPTPDDDPEGFSERSRRNSDAPQDPNEDTGPLPEDGDEEDEWDDGDGWKRT